MVKTRAMAEQELKEILALMQEMKRGQEEMKREQGEKLEEVKANIVSVINTKVDVIAEKVERNEERLDKIEGEIGAIEKKFEQEIEKIKAELKKGLCSEKSEISSVDELQNVGSSSQSVPEINRNTPVITQSTIKLSTYDGKTSWQVYKTQFSIVAEANGWDSLTKTRQLAASLRAEAADILRTIPENQQLNLSTLLNALELRFGEKCLKDYSRLQLKSRQQRPNETLQELATDVERLSNLGFSDCPTDVRDTLSLQYFIDAVRDVEIQKALRLAELKDLKSALIYAMKFEAAQQASGRDRHMVRGAEINDTYPALAETIKELRDMIISLESDKNNQKRTIRCWRCGTEGHVQRNCQARQDQRARNASGNKEQEN